ncbi:hypothetical protein BT69DRAFT_322913 [Atractiella rhizophila]|nr:hypothetical protein BT69DRAFT_322913 [Atractiella rhizophila]
MAFSVSAGSSYTFGIGVSLLVIIQLAQMYADQLKGLSKFSEENEGEVRQGADSSCILCSLLWYVGSMAELDEQCCRNGEGKYGRTGVVGFSSSITIFDHSPVDEMLRF